MSISNKESKRQELGMRLVERVEDLVDIYSQNFKRGVR